MMDTHRFMGFAGWRAAVRPLLAVGVNSDEIDWDVLRAKVGSRGDVLAAGARPLRLPAALMELLENVACFRHPGRWEFMYRLAWRAAYENARLLEDAADADVARGTAMDRAVRRDCHKMHAYVRFREVIDANSEKCYLAWFEPEHEILPLAAPFFSTRFANMRWTIATPDGAAVWVPHELRFIDVQSAAGVAPSVATHDDHEDLWRTYYRSICNVARINPSAMQREMPKRYWHNLPEAREIAALVHAGGADLAGRHGEAAERANSMSRAVRRALDNLPPPEGGPQACRRCDLWRHATQAVPGEGPPTAHIMLVGEQPGDEEDLRGQPFVGPAGKVLDAACDAAELDRRELFVTNAVKHFKWEPRGKRRLHKKPGAGEINACNIWLDREIAAVKPRVIVALGATALRALVGSAETIEAARRQTLVHASGAHILATYHPSAILRSEGERAEELRAALIQDLGRARSFGN